MMVHSPVVDPFSERVGVEDRSKQNDRRLSRIPILDTVAGGNTSGDGVVFGRFAGDIGVGCRLRLCFARRFSI